MTIIADLQRKIPVSNIIETSKTFVSVESIEYADGSVVSKTILKKPTGNITLFAFDKGEGLAEHSSPFEALIQLLDGKAEITIGETSYHLQAGQNIILPANIPHSLKANEKFKMMLTMIKS
jgi:quercetin dioxygenase-like cupin family protein